MQTAFVCGKPVAMRRATLVAKPQVIALVEGSCGSSGAMRRVGLGEGLAQAPPSNVSHPPPGLSSLRAGPAVVLGGDVLRRFQLR